MLVIPALFAAGMSLVDTVDGIMMLGAYEWAFVRPLRKLYYNLTITLVSVVGALLIGGIEVLGLLADPFKLAGPFWDAIGVLNNNFNHLGFIIIAIFLLAWLTSFIIDRIKGFDTLETVTTG